MTETLKAIQTRYKGYRFRSRLEARWAVFFDAMGVRWEYEAEGYDLGTLGLYLPDFVLSGDVFVEIKPSGVKVEDAAWEKCEELGRRSQQTTLMVIGTPDKHIAMFFGLADGSAPDEGTTPKGVARFCQCRKCSGLAIGFVYSSGDSTERADRDIGFLNAEDYQAWRLWCEPGCRGESVRAREHAHAFRAAVAAAMGARFEHGESGAR